jgi:peptidyl-dipeptidase A
MSLDLQELSEEWLFSVLDELEELTQDPFDRWKSDLDGRLSARFDTGTLKPWHYADPFFQHPPAEGRVDLDPFLDGSSAPELAARTFAGWGLDISPILEASDLWPRLAKCQHAFCLSVDRSGTDVRILANVVPGERWIDVLLHESGHAAYDAAIDRHLPWVLRRAAHTFVTEAIAIMSGALVKDPQWLVSVAGLPADGVRDLTGDLRAALAGQKILFARWGLLVAHFERDLYSDPEIDLDARWWELVERFQSIEPAAEAPSGAWASKIHIAVAPVYYHNYLLGEILAAQLRSVVERECGSFVGNRAAGEFLQDRIFRHGQLMRWDALVESAVGKKVSARDFVAAF